MLDRIIDIVLNFGVGAFAITWIGLIVSAAASVPIVGFVAAIPAALVVYAVRAAVSGSARARIERISI